MTEINNLKGDVGALKRSMKDMASCQQEMMKMVKALKRSHDSDNFEIGKCCHMVR